jgi:hypothetical protein
MRLRKPAGPSRASLPWIITVIALVMAMGGTGFAAAQRYIITQKNQIKPSVLRQLKGAKGPKGARGLPGTPGVNGVNGVNGAPGTPGSARAYARVGLNGVIPTLQAAVGFASVTHPAVGTCCLPTPPGVPQNGVALVSPVQIAGVVIQAAIVGPPCNPASDIMIFTTNQAAAPVDFAFSILVP